MCENRSHLCRESHLYLDDPNKSIAPVYMRIGDNSSEIRRWPLNYYAVPLHVGSSTTYYK